MTTAKETFKQICHLLRKREALRSTAESMFWSELDEGEQWLATQALEDKAEILTTALLLHVLFNPKLYAVAVNVEYTARKQSLKGIKCKPDYLADKTDPYITGTWAMKYRRFYKPSTPEQPDPAPMRWDELIPHRLRSELMFASIPF